MESPKVSWRYLFHSFHRFTQYLVSSTVLLGTPFALALRISFSVFGAANVREWFEGGWACLMGGACLSDKFWVCDSSDFS